MAGSSGWIDTSGSLPALKVGAVVTGMFATVVYGMQTAFLRFFNGVTSGYFSFVDGIAHWVETFPTSVIDGGVGIMDVATQGHIEWLASLGLVAYPVVVVEAVVVVALLLFTTRLVITAVLGAI